MNIDGNREILFRKIENISNEALNLQKVVGEDIVAFTVSRGADRQAITEKAYRDFLRGRGLL